MVKPQWAHQKRVVNYVNDNDVNYYALFHDMGCLTGDTEIKVTRAGCSRKYKLSDLYRSFIYGFDNRIPTKIRAYKQDKGVIGLHNLRAIIFSGIKTVYELELSNGSKIKATADHEFLTRAGFKRLDKLTDADRVMIDTLKKHDKKFKKVVRKKPRYNILKVGDYYPYGHYTKVRGVKIKRAEKHRLIYEAHINGLSPKEFIKLTYNKVKASKLKYVDTSLYHIHHKNRNPKDNCLSNLQLLTKEEHLREHGNYNNFGHGLPSYAKVKRITKIGKEDTYDIVCHEPYRNFVANGMVVHNCGKTRTGIEIYRNKCIKADRLLKCLIIGPLATVQSWKREILQFSNIKESSISVVDGRKTGGKTVTLKQKQAQLDNKYGIYIVNTEVVGNDTLWKLIEKLGIEYLIIDEAHNFKSYSAKRTKELMAFSRKVKFKFTSTGTPVLQNALDLWAQFYILNPDILGANFFSFRAQYFYDANASMPSQIHFPDWKVKDDKYFNRLRKEGVSEDELAKQSLNNLRKVIFQHADRVMKKDVLELPKFSTEKILVEMSEEQNRIYHDMAEHLVATLDGSEDDLKEILEEMPEVMQADLAIVKTLRLMQICAGVVRPDDGPARMLDKVPRLDKLEKKLIELLTGTDNKVIIWSIFRPTYQAIANICDKHGIRYVFLTGETKDKQLSMDSFNDKPDVRVIIANQAAGGTGVTLNAANYSLYYSRSFNLAHDLQSEARNYRGGQTRDVTRIDLVTEDTIDAEIIEALANKKAHAEDILSPIGKEFTKDELAKLLSKGRK